jgi:cytidylate kinase
MNPNAKQPFKIITIDGAAATGKSTTANAIAKELGFLHVDTGSHFRILCHHLIQKKITPKDPNSSLETILRSVPIDTEIIEGSAILKIGQELLKAKTLRTEEINNSVSKFASMEPIRNFLLEYQRSLKTYTQDAGIPGMVIEGRDIGSVVFPDAYLKIFLYADEKTRIARRKNEGQIDPISKRDDLDSTRKIAPLTCPQDALKLNTSLLSLDQVIDSILKHIESA